MKLEVKRVTPIFHLELTEREATILCALLGGVCTQLHPTHSDVGDCVELIWSMLDDELPNRIETFTDFFEVDDHKDVVVK